MHESQAFEVSEIFITVGGGSNTATEYRLKTRSVPHERIIHFSLIFVEHSRGEP